MKKMLFIIPSFLHGGTNRSFCNIIDIFNFEKHSISVDILCIKEHSQGVYKAEYQSRGMTILPENKALSLPFYKGKNKCLSVVRWLYQYLPVSIQKRYFRRACACYSRYYDAVVALQEGICTEIASYVDAPCRYAWLRCMYDTYYANNSNHDESPYYNLFDSIICVSEACKNSLLSIYPQYVGKVVCIPNTQNKEAIFRKSLEDTDIVFSPDSFNIVSVGRLDKVKQFHRIPQIVKEITEKGGKVNWYIIGDGSESSAIAEQAVKYGVESMVHQLGSRINPYPVMRKADIVAVTSLAESFCNVIAEAEILGVPVISTAFSAAYEAMKHKKRGIICPIEEFATHIYDSLSCNNVNETNDTTLSYTIGISEEKQFIKKLEDVLCL